jgi:histidinol-phosphate aminotransferase
VTDKIRACGLEVTESVGNFVLVHFPATGSATASKADEFLLSKGIILRRVSAYGLPNALRLTVGLEHENLAVIDALTQFLAA